MKDKNNDLPEYLEEFLHSTRSSFDKLLAAWDGLSVETQIKLLTKLEEKKDSERRKTPNNEYLYKKVFLKALDSPNSYVRYLAVRNLYPIVEYDEEEVKKLGIKIDKDKSSLVRSAKFERRYDRLYFLDKLPKDFIQLSHDEKLARARGSHIDGTYFAEILQAAAEDGKFEDGNAQIELIELLVEYLNNDNNNATYYLKESNYIDGYLDYKLGQELENLWNVIPKLPEFAGQILVRSLPPKSSGLGIDPFKGIIYDLTDDQLNDLLMREDIPLIKFRKEVFWRDEIKKDKDTFGITQFWGQAAFHHFSLDEEEFSKILNKPIKEQKKRFQEIAQSNTLDLYQYLIIISMLKKFNKENKEDSYNDFYIDFAEEALKKRLDNISFDKEQQLIKLRLYNQAVESRKWGNMSQDELTSIEELLIDKRVKNDTWKTFLAFVDAFKESEFTLEDLYPSDYEGGWDWDESETEEKALDKKLADEFYELGSQLGFIKQTLKETRFLLLVIGVVVIITVFK